MKKNNIIITFKSIEKNFETYFFFIKILLKKLKIEHKTINLPKKKKLITLLKSPHVNKKALEHFEINKYKKILYLRLKNEKLNFYKFLILNKPKFIKINIRKII